MKQSDLISVIAAAMMVAAAVAIFIAPKLDTPDTAEITAAPVAETVSAATIDATKPSDETVPSGKAAILRQKDDGHYWGLADVDGFPVNFMVDTGASVVVLTYKDAKRLHLKPDELDYKWNISTAGGQIKGASVLLESIRIGGVEIENVEAMILREGLEQNLLGMSFLRELYSYEFRGKQMIIRQ